MKPKLIQWARRYAAALRTHLQPGNEDNPESARRLGHQAVALGLETLDLARIHEQALPALVLPGGSARRRALMGRRAGIFFSEANFPIEETHCVAQSFKTDLSQARKNLGRRTQELAAARRQLQTGVHRRQVMEDSSARSRQDHDQCLEESLHLQNHLRSLTHRVIAAQEHERTKISHELQDEIVQTLVGINVRLLSLKNAARNNTRGLKNHIATTQRLVVKSAKSVRRFARELAAPASATDPRSPAAP